MEWYQPHLLLISGNGRESGKTLFACSVIRDLCENFKIIAVKISPHSYSAGDSQIDSFGFEEELLPDTGKDSSRLLEAGAHRSFFITAADKDLDKAGEFIADWCSLGYFVICESGGLRKQVTPELFIIVSRNGVNELKPGVQEWIKKDHVLVTYDGQKFSPDPQSIRIESEKWRYRHD